MTDTKQQLQQLTGKLEAEVAALKKQIEDGFGGLPYLTSKVSLWPSEASKRRSRDLGRKLDQPDPASEKIKKLATGIEQLAAVVQALRPGVVILPGPTSGSDSAPGEDQSKALIAAVEGRLRRLSKQITDASLDPTKPETYGPLGAALCTGSVLLFLASWFLADWRPLQIGLASWASGMLVAGGMLISPALRNLVAGIAPEGGRLSPQAGSGEPGATRSAGEVSQRSEAGSQESGSSAPGADELPPALQNDFNTLEEKIRALARRQLAGVGSGADWDCWSSAPCWASCPGCGAQRLLGKRDS